MMSDKPINLEAVRQADADLARLLEEHPELREPNPERQQALEDWLQDHIQEDMDDATTEDRETIRPPSDLQ
jgi:hypothetical protein